MGIEVPLKDRISLTVEEAAALTGIGATTIWWLMKTNRVTRRKVKGRTFVLREELEQYLRGEDTMPHAGKESAGEKTSDENNEENQ